MEQQDDSMEQHDNSMEQHQDTAQPAPAEPRIDVGAVLRAARESAGISVEEVAGRIKFAPRQIEALEEGDFSQLPQITFVRGFVRSYARLLELDEKALLDALPGAPAAPVPVEHTSGVGVVPRRGSERYKQNLFWLGGAVALAAVVIIAWRYDAGQAVPQNNQGSPAGEAVVAGNSASSVVAASSVAAASAPTAAASAVNGQSIGTSAATTQPTQTAKPMQSTKPEQMAEPAPSRPTARAQRTIPAPQPPAPKVHAPERGKVAENPPTAPVSGTQKSALQAGSAAIFHAGSKIVSGAAASSTPASLPASHPAAVSRVLHIQFDEDSWVEVKDGSGHILLSMMGRQGSSRTVSGPPPLHVVVGNANGVKLRYRGKPVELVPASGSNVVRLKLE